MNHQNADLVALEATSACSAELSGSELVELCAPAVGVTALRTCHRVELYLEVAEDNPAGVQQAAQAFATHVERASGQVVRPQVLLGDEVAQHLFSVAAGLESISVGEPEIAGQVRRALQQARTEDSVTPALDTLFQAALAASHQARARTDLSQAGRSLVQLALDLAETRFQLRQTRILLLGTGSYAATTLQALTSRGAQDIAIYSQSQRGDQLAGRFTARIATDLAAELSTAELVITCANSLLIQPSDLPAGSKLIIDLGMPRNVAPEVDTVPGVELLNVESLGKHAQLFQATAEANETVRDAATRFIGAQAARESILQIQQHFDLALQQALARPGGDAPEVAAALRHLVRSLAHQPLAAARRHGYGGTSDQFAQAWGTVFGASERG